MTPYLLFTASLEAYLFISAISRKPRNASHAAKLAKAVWCVILFLTLVWTIYNLISI